MKLHNIIKYEKWLERPIYLVFCMFEEIIIALLYK